MATNQYEESFVVWLDKYMRKGNSDQPGRIIVVMATFERLRRNPSLQKEDHLTSSNMQLVEHDHHVACALDRCKISSPVRAFGRRSSNLGAWIGPLLKWVKSQGFVSMNDHEKERFLSVVELMAAGRLQIINEGQPLIARFNEGTAVAVLVDILDQAQKKKRAKDVAEYLVGAKLQLKFGEAVAEPKNVNTPNRDRPADFHIGNAAIEVTVNPPDKRHLSQITAIIRNTGSDVWLLVRHNDREKWQNAVDATIAKQLRGRVEVTGIEAFVGQNVAEIGKFDPPLIATTLTELFTVYNDRWLPKVGGNGLRIVSVDPEHDL